MIYNRDGPDIFKPVAAFMGGLAVVRVTDRFMDVVLARAGTSATDIVFTHAFSKRLSG
jgi:cytolysin (calcineurin-like family phosphatase)